MKPEHVPTHINDADGEMLIGQCFAGCYRRGKTSADVVVAPYRRAAASGPISLTMTRGLPLVTTTVPALEEACRDYQGVEFAIAGDAGSLRAAIDRSLARVGEHYSNPHSWDATAEHYRTFFDGLPRAVRPTSRLGATPRPGARSLASRPT